MQDLADFQADLDLAAKEKAAQAELDKIDEQKAANDKLAEEQKKAEDARFEKQKKAFEAEFKKLQEHLDKKKHSVVQANAEINALLGQYGLEWAPGGGIQAAGTSEAAGVAAAGATPGTPAGGTIRTGTNISISIQAAGLLDPNSILADQLVRSLEPALVRALTPYFGR
jgi:acyl-homoserine lactone acylase PvdQ